VSGIARRRGERGFALLAALLVASIAALSIATLVAVVLSSAAIAADDAAAARAADAARAGVTDALQRLRWGWLAPGAAQSPTRFGPLACGDGSYTVAVSLPAGGDLVPRLGAGAALTAADPGVAVCRVDATGVCGHVSRTLHAMVLVTPDGLPRGLVVGADAQLGASVTLSGCGLYVGGDVDGREWVACAPPGGGAAALPPADLAYDGLWSRAGVHAVGHVLAAGVDEHTLGSGPAPAADSDVDSGVVPPAALVAPPAPATLADLGAHAADPGAALGADGLDLALLDRAGPPALGAPAAPAGGWVYVVAAPHVPGGLALRGARPGPSQACPVTVVVLGDCTVAAAPSGAQAALSGALIVTGELAVDAPLQVDGGVFVGRLVVRAPLQVSFSGLVDAPGGRVARDVSWRD
jgi:hypothetical protein